MENKKIVVCGATGNQGSAVVESLLKKNCWEIVGLTRNLDSDKAATLKNKGIKLLQADLMNKASLINAFKNAKGVFAVTQPWSPDYKKCFPKNEIEQGHNIIDACRETGVEHLVITSVVHLDLKQTGISHVDSKIAIENYLKQSNIPHTLLRLASFMDNIGASFFPVKKGKIQGITDRDAKVIYIACKDIGEFAAICFQQPGKFINKDLDLIGDFINGEELAMTMEKIRNGEHFKFSSVPKFLMKIFAKEFYDMRVLFEKWGRPVFPPEFAAAIKNCKEIHPEIMTIEKYLKYKGYDVKNL